MPDAASKTQLLQEARTKPPSSTERIWGKQVLAHGYTAIPSILIRAQARLGITPLQMNILVQLLDYWRDPSRRPFPTKKEIASRINVTDKTIQTNIRQLELAGLIRREQRKTAAGDWSSNIYHLDGLVDRIRKLEPDFAAARERRRKAKELAETPAGRRGR